MSTRLPDGERGVFPVDPALVDTVTMGFQATCPGYALSHVTVRGHTVTIDEPPERGGNDEGPTPTETFISALVGVTNVILRRLALRDGIAIRSLAVETDAELDRRGVWLREALPTPWVAIRQTLAIDTDADDARLDLWRHDLLAFSPVHSVLVTAGTPVTIAWRRA